MSKTFIFLCLLFLLVLGIYLWLVYNNAPEEVKNQESVASPKQILPQQVVLSFVPNTISASSDATQTVAVQIQTHNVTPTVIELELSYDPNVLSNITVNPGPYFSHPTIPLNLIDPSAGRISYALQEQQPGSPAAHSTGIVATISFTTPMTYLPLQSQISFLPRTLVHAQSEKNLLTTSNGLKIAIIPLVAPVQKPISLPIKTVTSKTTQPIKK